MQKYKRDHWKNGMDLNLLKDRLFIIVVSLKNGGKKCINAIIGQCRECKHRNKRWYRQEIQAYHIRKFSKYPELRFDINNGITLCKPCHNRTKGLEDSFIHNFERILNVKPMEVVVNE